MATAREGEREREEARPGQELTPERMPWTVMAGEAGIDGERDVGRRPVAAGNGSAAAIEALPGRFLRHGERGGHGASGGGVGGSSGGRNRLRA